MDRIEFTVRDATTTWPGARQYRIACAHGVSSATVLPGASPLADLIVVDLIVPGHQRRHGCSCEIDVARAAIETVSIGAAAPALATAFLA
jgi:hypothetical protein